MKIAVFFVGALHDTGFNACALEGAEAARDLPGAEIEIVHGVPFDPAAMTSALTAAADRSDAVVFIGGQGNRVTPEVAARFPDRAFAIVQGEVTAPNIASYDVLQEHSAFLAGCLAAKVTLTGTVGHLSGHRVTPGLKGRAAFAAGVAHTDPAVRLVTTRACRNSGIRQIGNVGDWTLSDPEVYIASAVARIDLGVRRAVADLLAVRVPPDVDHLGLAEGAVQLALAPDVDAALAGEIAAMADRIADGTLPVPTTYDGPEMDLAS